ncbi:hypothetical protein ACWEPM_25880 [Streptomyces sp. NPDC004244]|uniref:hypothetical protein n=1 Tax=Streptomyces sp. NPDC101206 TaxID=3366128 RepID=UPI0038046726
MTTPQPTGAGSQAPSAARHPLSPDRACCCAGTGSADRSGTSGIAVVVLSCAVLLSVTVVCLLTARLFAWDDTTHVRMPQCAQAPDRVAPAPPYQRDRRHSVPAGACTTG